MQVLKKIRLIWTFYQSFVLASMVITVCCLYLYYKSDFTLFAVLFWFKLATLGLIFYFVNSYQQHQYYYYQNLGVSKVLLWAATLTFDFALFLFLLFQTYKLT